MSLMYGYSGIARICWLTAVWSGMFQIAITPLALALRQMPSNDRLDKLFDAREQPVRGLPVARLVSRFVARAERVGKQLPTFCEPPGIHLRIGESCSNKRVHFQLLAANSDLIRHMAS